MVTAQVLIERSLKAYRKRIAVVDAGRIVTYAQIDERSARLANALLALGCSAETPAAIFLSNSFHFVEIDAACMRAGVARVGISTRLSPDECRFIVEHSGAAILITTSALLAKIEGSGLEGLSTILLADVDKGAQGRVRSYEQVLAAASDRLSVAAVPAESPAYILYTSGTTGRPKGATHTQGSRVAAMVNMLASEIEADHASAMVHCAPLTHGSGSKILTFIALGARNVVLQRFDPGEFARTIVEHGGTHTFMVPTMLQMLLDGGDEVAQAIRRMRQVSFGGAPITDALFGRAVEAFGPRLTQVYGSCEAPHPVTVLKPGDYSEAMNPQMFAGSAGRASHSTELRCVDDDGRDVAIGEEGELLVRGAYLMRGYWRDEEATNSVVDANGWYSTGDIAVIDESGLVYFRDRKRDLIISGGLNVYPSEVERVLAEHPNVSEVAVVGYPDERWGESVLAFVVPRDKSAASADAILAWVDGRIAGYKKPRQIRFLDALPKGTTNKVLKRDLKAELWAGRGRRIN